MQFSEELIRVHLQNCLDLDPWCSRQLAHSPHPDVCRCLSFDEHAVTSLTPVTTTFTLCHIRPLLGLDTAKAMAVSILLAVDSAVVPSVL